MSLSVLVIGGGIGGLTAAIALRQKGVTVEVIERDPEWSVYGVGIIQQSNVVRAVHELGVLDAYIGSGFGFDAVDIYLPDGSHAATIPSPKLAEGYPANVGIGRPALQKVLADRVKDLGVDVRLGVTAESLEDDGQGVTVTFSDGAARRYDLVVGADGLYSKTREAIFPDAPKPQPTGQGVWRYNFKRPEWLKSLNAYHCSNAPGLVPLSDALMYMYVTAKEDPAHKFPTAGLAEEMRKRLAGAPPVIQEFAAQITDDEGVVYRPLFGHMLTGPWHKGRVVLLGDAVHGTTPHLGQGAGMAIEDSLVLADELSRHPDDHEAAFTGYRARQYERCAYIVDRSRAIGDAQLGLGPPIDYAHETREMFRVVSAPL